MSRAPVEPPIYRPFALLSFGATVLVGTPVGLRLLAWLYGGWPALAVEWRHLHAHMQLFGFFATLIPGVAQHLMARFTGRAVARHPAVAWIAAALGAALALRVLAIALTSALASVVAALLQTAGFTIFAWEVWRVLDPPPLGLLRRHLTLSTSAFALAMLLESIIRISALSAGDPLPQEPWMRSAHAIGLYGVLGWILGVLLRAGPMFVPGWMVPTFVARGLPGALTLAVLLAVIGEIVQAGSSAGQAIARAGDTIALAMVVAVILGGGMLRSAPGTLPMVGRTGPESRIFRLALGSALAAAPGYLFATALSAAGMPIQLITDALRHLVTVGFTGAVVVAMVLRLVPVLEGRALPWPAARVVAFWSLLAAVIVRSAEVVAAYEWPVLAPAVPLSGVLAWMAFAAVAVNVVSVAVARRA